MDLEENWWFQTLRLQSLQNTSKTRVKFNGSCLTQNKTIFYHIKIAIYIAYELILHNSDSNYPTLENCLFGAVKLTRGTNIDNHKYFGYGIGFDRKGVFSIGDDVGRNVIIFVADMSLSPHIDNKGKDILILGRWAFINCRKIVSN